MLRFIAAIGLIAVTWSCATVISVSTSASADEGLPVWPPSKTQDCAAAVANDKSRLLKKPSRHELVTKPEVIVEGVIESYRPGDNVSDMPTQPVAMMRVDKVWKGDVAPHIALSFWMTAPDCVIPPLIGKRIRFGGQLVASDVKVPPYQGLGPMPDADSNVDIVRYWGFMDIPLGDPELDRLLDAYRAKTEALRQAAATGDKQARLAYAEHLRANNETHRAFEIYDALLRENPNDLDLLLVLAVARTRTYASDEPEKTLQEVAHRAPNTEEWRRKIDRARFAAIGILTSGEQDWSGLKRTNSVCYSDHGNFDNAVFDRSDFSECAFRYSSFRGASFLGTDLTASYFQNSDLTGAKYDCETKLPDELDAVAAGMINTDGACAKP